MNFESQEESKFAFEELFFSRTDLKGNIVSGNSVFTRVSGYAWGELSQKPHNIIRHPDMPKAVFYLLWERLKQNKPVGAYVKNRSKDGRYYWVFALAMPVDGGYLSVRLKPSSPILKIVVDEYDALRIKENAERLHPQQSLEWLLKKIKELGFETYEDFMTDAILAEVESRQINLKQAVQKVVTDLKRIKTLANLVEEQTGRVLKTNIKSQYVPLNLEIQSLQLSDGTGDSMSVVASQYQKMVGEIAKEIDHFQSTMRDVKVMLKENQFIICANLLLSEVVEFFKIEVDQEGANKNVELNYLTGLMNYYKNRVSESVKKVIEALVRFESVCNSMRTAATGLEIVRLTGKIEASRIESQKTTLDSLIAQLGEFRNTLMEAFEVIRQSNVELKSLASDLRSR